MEEAEAASPAAHSHHLPLWVESNAVQRPGTRVLEGQLPTDCVPQLKEKEREKTRCLVQIPKPLKPRGHLVQPPALSLPQAPGKASPRPSHTKRTTCGDDLHLGPL